jgi:LCP family protein required for cell wall assembly
MPTSTPGLAWDAHFFDETFMQKDAVMEELPDTIPMRPRQQPAGVPSPYPPAPHGAPPPPPFANLPPVPQPLISPPPFLADATPLPRASAPQQIVLPDPFAAIAAPPDRPLAYPPPTKRRAGKPRKAIGKWVRRGTLVLGLLVVVLVGLLLFRAYTFGATISNQPPLSSQIPSSGRVSLVFLGYGGPGHDGPYLTDSILVITIDRSTGKSAFISVPRDLWVQVPANSGHYAKLNTAYAYGMANGGPFVGGQMADQKLTTVLGISVPYFISVNFSGFAGMVDALGGVDITVPDTFNASLSPTYAPAIHFHAGPYHMDGALALFFARARYCTPATEASDFARSIRQQILMRALASKLKSPTSIFDYSAVMDAMQPNVKTNLSLRDLYTIFTSVDFSTAKRIGITNDNVLMDATSSDGQAILLPRDGNWSLISQYVQQQLNQ